MGIVDDLLRMQAQMATDRAYWEDAWRDIADMVYPSSSRLFSGASGVSTIGSEIRNDPAQKPSSIERSRELYDPTAVWAAERLTSGMESLVIPRAQKWHSLSLDDPFDPEPTDLQEEWLDRLRDYLFAVRYDAKSNFALSAQKAMRSTCVFGTGILYSEENLGRRNVDPVKAPFFYRHVPLIEAYLGVNAYDVVDKCIRLVDMPARAAVDYFGSDNVSAKVREKAASPENAEKPVTFCHAVLPRDEAGDYKTKKAGFDFASFWFEPETKHLIKDSGFRTFPYHVMWWDQDDHSAYGRSPAMAVMPSIKMLQPMKKASLQSMQQLVKPPLATMPGVYRSRLNLNPGAVNPGYLDETGRLKAQPLVTTTMNPQGVNALLESERAIVTQGMYVNLFQILVDNPQMSATEAMLRANEKGDLLGPAGAKMEHGLGLAVDREIDIIGSLRAFDEPSPLAPPGNMNGKQVHVRVTGPLARLRRMAEYQGMTEIMAMVGNFAQYDQSVLDRLDADETLEMMREIRGAPRRMFKTDDEVATIRQTKAAQLEQQNAMMMAGQMADAAGKATPALKAMSAANQGMAA